MLEPSTAAEPVASNEAGDIQMTIEPQGVPQSPLPAGDGISGLPDFPGLDPTRPGALTARLRLAGVELTQSTQYASAAGGGYGQDNGVALVALKLLVARAYPVVTPPLLQPDLLTGQRVTGELVVSVAGRVVYRTGPTRSDGARVGRQQWLDRTLWDQEYTFSAGGDRFTAVNRLISVNSPLNFVVPAYYCRAGRADIAVRVWTLSETAFATWSDVVSFTDVSAPKVCLVRVNWTDGSGNRTSASDAVMLSSLSTAQRMLPFPYFETTVLSAEVESRDTFGAGPTSPGACNTAWDKLAADLAVTAIFTSLFGLGDIVIGFVPTAALPASGPYVSGCGRGGIGSFVADPITVTHEIGHLYDRHHVAVPGDPSSDTAYPNYGGDVRSIGEVGIDTGTVPPTLYDPASSDDLMSYGANQWISPYTYQAILSARSMHAAATARPSKVGRPFLVTAVRLYRDRSVEIRRMLQVDAPGQVSRSWEGAGSPLSVDILDANARVLFTHHLVAVRAQACCRGAGGCGSGCGGAVPAGREPWQDFDEAIEWPEGAHSLAFHDGGEPLLVVAAGVAPTVEVSPVVVGEVTSEAEHGPAQVSFRVTAQHQREAPSVVVLFTGDDGRTWWPVVFDPPEGNVSVVASSLPSRGSCRFRVVATAELMSTVVDTEPVDLLPAPRGLHLDLPDGDCGVAAGPVMLRVHIDLRGHGAPSAREVRWWSSIDGDLGVGTDLVAELSAGRHEVSVTAPDGVGGSLGERGIIIVGG